MAVSETKPEISQSILFGLVGYNLKRAYMRLHAELRDTLQDLEFTQRTFSVLSVVCENPLVSQSDVARTLGIERSGTVVIVDELEQRGLIQRESVVGDRRAYALRATEEGKSLHGHAMAAVRQHEDRMLDDLTVNEREQLRSLLARVHNVEKGQG